MSSGNEEKWFIARDSAVGRLWETDREQMITTNPAMRRAVELFELFGASRCAVLLCGETGTGKELAARAVHAASDVRGGPFEAVNCGAIPADLAESELFGHTRGAFTGAARSFRGAFQRADGGTLFLDEIGEMPSALQPKLLRALEDGMVRSVGSESATPVNVRVVAATHRDLERETSTGGFRLDLFHRLAVGIVRLPPLRERREDIPLLVAHFLDAQRGPGNWSLCSDVLPFLQQQRWPGNVRALRNAVERAALIGGKQLKRSDFKVSTGQSSDHAAECVRFRGRSFGEVRREIYERVLRAHAGNRSAAAMALQIPKSTFFDQLRAMGL